MGLKVKKNTPKLPNIGTGIHFKNCGHVLISGVNSSDNYGTGITAHNVQSLTCVQSVFNNNTDIGISVSNTQASSSKETKKMALNIFNNTVNNSEIGIS
ncbi:right-handed parallel beta-helix repeat-containing protein, partial [Enterobacter hormaechei]